MRVRPEDGLAVQQVGEALELWRHRQGPDRRVALLAHRDLVSVQDQGALLGLLVLAGEVHPEQHAAELGVATALLSDVWCGLAWGGFPVLCGYAAVAGDVRGVTVLAAVSPVLLSLARRVLPNHVRYVRRRVVAVRGELELADASREPLDARRFIAPAESGLRLLSLATVVLAATLVAFHL